MPRCSGGDDERLHPTVPPDKLSFPHKVRPDIRHTTDSRQPSQSLLTRAGTPAQLPDKPITAKPVVAEPIPVSQNVDQPTSLPHTVTLTSHPTDVIRPTDNAHCGVVGPSHRLIDTSDRDEM